MAKVKTTLNDKQEAYCQHYVKLWSGKKAAEAAGYSKKSAVNMSANLRGMPKIRARISELHQKIAKNVCVTQEMVTQMLLDIASDPYHKDQANAIDKLAKITGAYEKDNAQSQQTTNIKMNF